jgi:hypothetical protein
VVANSLKNVNCTVDFFSFLCKKHIFFVNTSRRAHAFVRLVSII